MSFVSRVVSKGHGAPIYLVTGKDSTGRAAWYYVRIKPLREVEFKLALKSGTMDLTDYGEILESAYGEAPPPDVVAEVKLKYNLA